MQLNILVNNKLKTVALGMLAVVFAFALQMAMAPKAHATTYNLAPAPAPGDCNIYDAIAAINSSAASGGCDAGTSSNTINLAAGTYTLIGDLPAVTFDGDLTVNGVGATSTIVDGAGFTGVTFQPSTTDHTIAISNIALQNFVSSASGGTVIAGFYGSFTGDHLIIRNNTCTSESVPICAVFVNFSDPAGTQNIRLSNSAIYNNTATAIMAAGNVSGQAINVDLINNTIYNNVGTVISFFNGVEATTSSLNLVNNTISNNNFYSNFGWLGLNITFDAGIANVYVKNNIFNNNTSESNPNNCGLSTSTNGHIITQGGNVSSDDTCNAFFNGTNDKNSSNPLLGTFSEVNNTWVLPLLANSPAIDNGIAGGLTPSTDQRGVARPQGSAPDSGAYESTGFPTPTPGNNSASLASTGFDMKIPAAIAGLLVLAAIGAAGYSLRRR